MDDEEKAAAALNGFRGIKSGSIIDNSKGYLQCSSWKLQYELLESARLSILKKLVDRIHEAKMFSIIIEEATGISNSQKEQLCLTVRYYCDGEVCENFLIIRPLPSDKSDEITKHIMDAIKEVGIDFNKAKLIGQEYRGKVPHLETMEEFKKLLKTFIQWHFTFILRHIPSILPFAMLQPFSWLR
uniref:DUF4371 domain-containing protein n=1 Tax=Panagrolaimus sp. ES5 TaxID=591445 RepID=A0AC34GXG9_9BILA